MVRDDMGSRQQEHSKAMRNRMPDVENAKVAVDLKTPIPQELLSCDSPVVKILDHGRHVMSSNPVSLNTRRVGA
ncbi:hypothetical protein TNCV_2351091 [Trichonephila clavipes]|uniref:Uncharacterized protein n=1 Tax=Trichonephila clavipes TaxID=2585209 RepID=A0A8X6SN01_TRICX|nr:hypothetical protein TNCV_2351091 [Trichonephila clavipes]